MSDSFQNEIPRSRVNIALELETGGAKVKKELPLKLLVMGDFSNGKNNEELSERTRISVKKDNLESVMKDLSPQVSFNVPNKITDESDSEIGINLTFDSFKSFQPEQVAEQVPELNKLLAMRNLLKDLKSNLLDNSSLRKELERILANKPELEELKKQLQSLAPITNPVDPEEKTLEVE
jgi:type VI secretion system protein ImpB